MLRSQPYRDSDLIVTLFTEELGKVTALARGARRSQRRFAGALSMLVISLFDLVRAPRSEWWTLDSASAQRDWLDLSSDVVAVAHASYVLELLRELLPAESPEPSAVELVVELWDSLRTGASAAALRYVEGALLQLAGSAPALQRCAACGTALDQQSCWFDPARGGALCSTCAPHSRGHGTRRLSAEARLYLHELITAPSILAARQIEATTGLDTADRVAGREAMLAMIGELVPYPLKTVEFIAKLSKG